jgi:predicted permease
MNTNIILAIAEFFGVFAIGAIAQKTGYIEERDIDRFSRLVTDILMPLFIFHSVVSGFQTGEHAQMWQLPLLGTALVVIGASCGYLFRYGLFSKDKDLQKSFLHLCSVNNASFLPIVIIKNMWDDGTMANMFMMNLGSTFGTWTIGIAVLGSRSWKTSARNLVSPPLLSIIAAVVVSISGAAPFIPQSVMKIIQSAGSISIPLTLLITGATLVKGSVLTIRWPVIYITLLRLIVLPVISIVILRQLPLSHEVFKVTALVALMPSAVTSVIIIRRFGGSADYASSTALVSTLASILTIPVALHLLNL